MPYLRPDAKSQVTVEYSEEGKPLRIDTIVISTQHDDFIQPTDATAEAQAIADAEMQARITEDIRRVLLPRVLARYPEDVQRAFDSETKLLVNPTGKFVIGVSTEILVSRGVRSSSTPTEVRLPMVVVPSLARTPLR